MDGMNNDSSEDVSESSNGSTYQRLKEQNNIGFLDVPNRKKTDVNKTEDNSKGSR